MRILTKPATFMNQLQWSRNHLWILLGFSAIAILESLMGSQTEAFQHYALALEADLGLSRSWSVAAVITGRVLAMLGGMFVLSSVIWMLGNAFGRHTSKRVLFRRMSIVFTVMLGGYLCSHLSVEHQILSTVAFVAYVWAGVLAYFSIKEQFELNVMEAAIVGAVALFLVTTTWHYSHHFADDYFAARPIARSTQQQ